MPAVRLRAFVRLCDEVLRPLMTPAIVEALAAVSS